MATVEDALSHEHASRCDLCGDKRPQWRAACRGASGGDALCDVCKVDLESDNREHAFMWARTQLEVPLNSLDEDLLRSAWEPRWGDLRQCLRGEGSIIPI